MEWLRDILSATGSFTFAPPHEGVSPATVAHDVPDTTSLVPPLNLNLFPSGSGDYLPRAGSTGAHLSGNTLPDKGPIADSTTAVTPVLPNSPTTNFYLISEGPIGEVTPVDIHMEYTSDLEPPPGPTRRCSQSSLSAELSRYPAACDSPIAGEIPDDERSVLSNISYHNWYVTDRSIASPSSDDPWADWNARYDHRSPSTAMAGEQPLTHAHRRGSGGLLNIVDAPQLPSNSDKRIPNGPTGIDNQMTYLPRDARNESTDPIMSVGSLQVGVAAPRVQGTEDFADTQNGHLHPPSSDVTPSSVEDPDLPMIPCGRMGTGDSTTNPSASPVNNATPPIQKAVSESAVPPQVGTRAPSVPPLRRARTRGVFIIGNGAPIKIDESLEVRLRDGINGRVDFII